MHNAEKPNPPASVRDTGGEGGLSASSKTRARNSHHAVAPQSAPSGEVHGEAGLTHHFSLGFLGFSWKIQLIHMIVREYKCAVLVTTLSESRKTVRQKFEFVRDTKLPT